jgi:general secretion pathway protein E
VNDLGIPVATGAPQAGAELARLAERFGCPVLSVGRLHELPPAFDLLPYAEAHAHRCLVLRDEDGRLLLAAGDPEAEGFLAWADARLRRPFTLCLADPRDITAVLGRHADGMRALDQAVAQEAEGGSTLRAMEDLSLGTIQLDESPVVRLTNSTLYDAYKAGASDIHLETTPEGLTVKYRLDGVLSVAARVPGLSIAEQAISRIKVMAELDIAERRVPQDGRIRISINGREVDLRVSVMPSIHGEDAVLRILDKQALTDQVSRLTLDFLGFDREAIRTVRRLAREPHGMLLVTGPTGSGKTTTLYAVITEINDGRDKIVTIEDPVEYQLPGVLQIPVNEKKGLSFARGLRSILRHDPDRIMVGEIRDEETAQIAVQSALTGHLVLTTVHANNVFDVISRFLHMGVAPHAFASAINGVLAQRLIRLNCPQCSEDDRPDPELIAESGIGERDLESFRFRKGRGCGHCRGTGFKGRRAVAELLRFTGELKELVVGGASTGRLQELAFRQGMRPIRETALDLARRGESTLEEINRVTFVA